MDVLLSIRDFAKMTYLSIRALRHCHDTGLLVPADVDPETGYRRYPGRPGSGSSGHPQAPVQEGHGVSAGGLQNRCFGTAGSNPVPGTERLWSRG